MTDTSTPPKPPPPTVAPHPGQVHVEWNPDALTDDYRRAVLHELRRQQTALQTTNSRLNVVAWLLGALMVLWLLGQLVAGIGLLAAY